MPNQTYDVNNIRADLAKMIASDPCRTPRTQLKVSEGTNGQENARNQMSDKSLQISQGRKRAVHDQSQSCTRTLGKGGYSELVVNVKGSLIITGSGQRPLWGTVAGPRKSGPHKNGGGASENPKNNAHTRKGLYVGPLLSSLHNL